MEVLELTYKKPSRNIALDYINKNPCGEIELKVESEYIRPKERKLKAVWSYEAAQDLYQWHSISSSSRN